MSTPRREQLLAAAARLILERGAGNLTLDAVCEAASVSKGGLLYYFDGKAALLEALIDDLTAQLESDIQQQAATDSDSSPARAYLRAVARMGERPRTQQLCKALTFICAAHPELYQRIQQSVRCSSHLRWSEPPASLQELHLRLVADGLWLADIYGAYQITPERRAALLSLLEVETDAAAVSPK